MTRKSVLRRKKTIENVITKAGLPRMRVYTASGNLLLTCDFI